MAHKTLIGGTAYAISGGKTLIGGTAYKIGKGKTLIGGTAHEISFKPPELVIYQAGDAALLTGVTINTASTDFVKNSGISTSSNSIYLRESESYSGGFWNCTIPAALSAGGYTGLQVTGFITATHVGTRISYVSKSATTGNAPAYIQCWYPPASWTNYGADFYDYEENALPTTPVTLTLDISPVAGILDIGFAAYLSNNTSNATLTYLRITKLALV